MEVTSVETVEVVEVVVIDEELVEYLYVATAETFPDTLRPVVTLHFVLEAVPDPPSLPVKTPFASQLKVSVQAPENEIEIDEKSRVEPPGIVIGPSNEVLL